MATMDLDPLFLKALALLRSKSRDSADQLKALLDEVLGKTSKTDVSSSLDKDRAEEKSRLSDEKSKGASSVSRKTQEDQKKGSGKRPIEKTKPDTNLNPTPPKKLKLEIPKRPSMVRKPVIEDDSDTDHDDSDEDTDEDDVVFIKDFIKEKKSDSIEELSSDSDDLPSINLSKSPSDVELVESTTADDFALELGLTCVICKKMDVSARNQLIECQECHNLYHQLCHKPSVLDADPNDPRLVWYCAKCQRNMKKVADKKSSKASPSSGSSPLESPPTLDKESGGSAVNFFKRTEPKTPPASSVAKSQPFTGFASLAANLSAKNSSSMKSGITSSTKMGQSTIIGAAAKNLKTTLGSSSGFKHTSKTSSANSSNINQPLKMSTSSGSSSSSVSGKVSSSGIKTSSSTKAVGHKSSLGSSSSKLSSSGSSSSKVLSTGSSSSKVLSSGSSSSKLASSSTKPGSISSTKTGSSSAATGRVTPVNVARHKLMSSSCSGSRSPSPQPFAGPGKGKVTGVKNLPQASQASAMKRLQQMKRKASKR